VLWKDGRGLPAPFTDGKFSAAVTNPGTYRIELRGGGYAKSSQELKVEQGRVYRLNFTLHPGGVIKGKVIDSTGRPLRDGDVFYKDGNTSYGVPIDQDGTYRIEGLAPGQYRVTVMAADKEVARSAQVEAGRETTADFVVK
jgi:outer membrane usher protein FimD/PapC